MRIAYVSLDAGVPVFGRKGCSVHVQEVIAAMVRRGHDVTLLTTRAEGERPPTLAPPLPPTPGGIGLVRLPALEGGAASPAPRAVETLNETVVRALRELGPVDLVYERHALWSWGPMSFAAARDVPGVLEVNAPLVDEQSRYRRLDDPDAAQRVADAAFGEAALVVAVSQGVAAHVRQRTDRPERVHVVPNGVDPDRFAGVAPLAPSGPCTIGFVGTLKPWHGIETLLDAFADVRRRHDDASLLIVGDGPQRDQIEHRIDELDLADRVELTGAVSPEEVPGQLARMDVAVAPYPPLEPFYFSPLKLLEYMAAGRAVVASSIGQINDLIEDGVTGLLAPAGDRERLAAALSALCGDAERRVAIGAAARRTTLRDHTWDAVVERILTLARNDCAVGGVIGAGGGVG